MSRPGFPPRFFVLECADATEGLAHDDDVAHRGVLALAAAEHLDALDTAGAGVVRHVEDRSHLDHGALLDLRGLCDDAHDDPPLAAAERPRLCDRHRVAHLGGVVLVVRDELRRLALRLAVDLVADLPLDFRTLGAAERFRNTEMSADEIWDSRDYEPLSESRRAWLELGVHHSMLHGVGGGALAVAGAVSPVWGPLVLRRMSWFQVQRVEE